MSASRPRIPFTYADYKSLPESMDRRYELLAGDLFMVPAPTTVHQIVSQNIEFILLTYVRRTLRGRVLDSPVDVVLGTGAAREVVQPDILFVAAERASIITRPEVVGCPDLVIEVLSPGTEERDCNYKKTLYARYGAREYWIVDPDAKILDRYVLGDNGFDPPERFNETASFSSPLFPDLLLGCREIFFLG
ncbi:MAG: Uma2 family endonuclease [Gammaproteobacteria bacterium]|nr:Uma2 family endonuclease [Gammaproteobacteria bacterium]